MTEATLPEPLAIAWLEAESAYWAASKEVSLSDPLMLAVSPGEAGDGKRGAFNETTRGPIEPTPAIETALDTLERLASQLGLERGNRGGPREALLASTYEPDAFWVTLRSNPPEDAFMRLLIDAEAAEGFRASRTGLSKGTEWDKARAKRVIREDNFGERCLIEPGAAWFVEWLESRGAETIFSCEGHPDGFYVTFKAPYDLAHRIAGAPGATIEIFRSTLLTGMDQWTLKLWNWAETFEERDDLLRELSAALIELDAASET